MTKKVAIIGASGYTGGELLRHLLFHDGVEIVAATSQKNAGKKICEVHPNLASLTEMKFGNERPEELGEQADVVFLATPHGAAMKMVPQMEGRTKIIDLSADYRLKDRAVFEKFYGAHSSFEYASKFVYGLPEINRAEVKNARNIANPGCFSAASILALAPLARENLLSGNVIVDAKTGSSGSGAEPTLGTHHPERAQDLRAYNVFSHRHRPEIEQALGALNRRPFDLTFTAHSVPMVRGIFATCYVFLERELKKEDLRALYEKYYGNEKFVRIVPQARSSVVKGTNFCDISIEASGKKAVITAAIDNLVKGAAGNAIQNMNLMLGFEETKSLLFPGMHP